MQQSRHPLFLGSFVAFTLLGCAAYASAAAIPTTNLALWLDAGQGVTTDTSSNVTLWQDQSGQGHDATVDPVVNSAPVLAANQINGLPAVQFNGGQTLDIAGQVLTSQQFTIFAVVTDTSDVSSGLSDIFSNWTGANSVQSVFLGTASGIDGVTRSVRFTDDIGGATDPNHTETGVGSVPSNTPLILNGNSTATDANIFLDGSLLYDNGAPLSTRELDTPYAVGAQGQNDFEFWQGDIAELIVYNSALSTDDFNAVNNYLDTKYLPEPASMAMIALLGLPVLARRRRA